MIDFDIHPAEPPKQALVRLMESRYGFSVVDVGLSQEDAAIFDQINIQNRVSFNWFSSLGDFEEGQISFLQAVGENDLERITPVAMRITDIARQILQASGKEVAWFCLRSSLPSDKINLKRWHMDGLHYRTSGIQYKFCMTLQGEATLFCLLSNQLKKTRELFWRHTGDLPFTNEFCDERPIFRQEKNEGIFFIMANSSLAAIHAEPEIRQPRLFLSIVPCDKSQIEEMKERIQLYYPPSEKERFWIGFHD